MTRSPSSAPAAARTTRCLVVDDEPLLAEIIAGVLAGLGLGKVDNYTLPAAALGSLAAVAGLYDFVVADRDMPGCDGLELGRRLRERAPGLAMILVTAHADDLPAEDLRRAGVVAVIPKPFLLAQLAQDLRRSFAPADLLPA